MRATSTFETAARTLLVSLALLATGCETVRYRMIPPPTESGRLCIAQCAAVREMCLGGERQEAFYAQEQCERRVDRDYRRCLEQYRGDYAKQKNCDSIRGQCWVPADTGRCEHDYRTCFTNCGGQVIQEIERY